jgi:hypothetical protein
MRRKAMAAGPRPPAGVRCLAHCGAPLHAQPLIQRHRTTASCIHGSAPAPRGTSTRHTVRGDAMDAGHLPPPLRTRNGAAAGQPEAVVLGGDAGGGDGGCLSCAYSVYSRPFSHSWPHWRTLGSPAGGLAAGHGDQGVDGIPITVRGGRYFIYRPPRAARGRPILNRRPRYIRYGLLRSERGLFPFPPRPSLIRDPAVLPCRRPASYRSCLHGEEFNGFFFEYAGELVVYKHGTCSSLYQLLTK